MPYVAFLRGINVGGKRRLVMTDLLGAFAELGFETRAVDPGTLEKRLEAETQRRFGMPIDSFVRTPDEPAAVLSGNPFPEEARDDPSHVLVMFLRSVPEAERAHPLASAIAGRERVHVAGQAAYIVYPDGIGRSPVADICLERSLGTRGAARNWTTLCKLQALEYPKPCETQRLRAERRRDRAAATRHGRAAATFVLCIIEH